jgi:hypothetical protein
VHVHKERADDDDRRREEDASEEAGGQDRGILRFRRFAHDGFVDRVDAESLGGRTFITRVFEKRAVTTRERRAAKKKKEKKVELSALKGREREREKTVEGQADQKRKGLTVHEDVDEEDLHRVERIAHPKGCRDGDDEKGGDGRRELEDEKVLDVVEDGFA